MKYFTCVLFFILLLFSIGVANAGTAIVLSPDGGHSNQNQINEALKNGDVFLNAGVYEIDDNIIMPSNRVLTGDSNAIIRVWSGSSAWFTGLKGVINCGNTVAHDIEISGFQIDGNIGNLPSSYADSRADTDHDQEKLIILHGYSNQFASNITIRNMKLYNSFSDGIYILFAEGVAVSNNFISNAQHEGFYLSCVNYGLVYGNKIAGICSDCGRLDNCQYCKVYDNYFFSYNGESYGQYKGGQAGLQIANAMSSHGYNAANKPQKTDQIEVTNNTFADPGRQAIWLHNYDGSVYVHDNEFKDAKGLETLGIPVGDISVDNPPTVEMSEKVFSSIFDILDIELSETGNVTQGEITPEESWQNGGKYTDAYIYLAGYEGEITIGNEKYIPESPDKCAIVYTNTKNLASKPDGQTSTLKLSTGKNNTLECKLTVKTTYRVRTNKTVTVGGKTIKNPIKEYKNKSETVVFTKTFDAPKQFPAVKAPKVYVTYYNGSHAIVEIPDVPGIVKTDISINRSSAREYRLIGEVGTAVNGFRSTRFDEVSTWKYSGSQMSMSQSGLYIKEPFDIDQLHISVTTPYKKMEVTDIEYVVIEDESSKFLNVGLLTLIVLCLTYGRAIYKIIIMVVGKYL